MLNVRERGCAQVQAVDVAANPQSAAAAAEAAAKVRTTCLRTRARQKVLLNVLTRVLRVGACGAGSGGRGGSDGSGRRSGLPSVPCVSSRAGRSGGLGRGSARGSAGGQPLRSGGRVEAVRVDGCYREWAGSTLREAEARRDVCPHTRYVWGEAHRERRPWAWARGSLTSCNA
jgi:hypothetical protein